MAWVETESLSFIARHETEDEGCAQRTLDRLEDLRLRLEERFDDAPGGITAVIHPSPGWLIIHTCQCSVLAQIQAGTRVSGGSSGERNRSPRTPPRGNTLNAQTR